MGAVRKISIALTEELAADVERAVESGDYASSSEVIRDALRAWRDDRALKLAELRRLVEDGLASGPPQPVSDDWFDDIVRRGKAGLAKER
jgi:antitoxin ParD1/3/4